MRPRDTLHQITEELPEATNWTQWADTAHDTEREKLIDVLGGTWGKSQQRRFLRTEVNIEKSRGTEIATQRAKPLKVVMNFTASEA
eukprot:5962901-Amphidinium_carterae.1